MSPLTTKNEFFIQHDYTINDVIEFYKEYVNMIKPSYMETLNYKRPLILKNGITLHDSHPLPTDHYRYLELIIPQYAVNKELAIKWEDMVSTLDGEHDVLWNDSRYKNFFDIIVKGRKNTIRL
jgi:hypothetical protein